MRLRAIITLGILLCLSLSSTIAAAAAQDRPAPDITGRWQASFESQIGTQTYTYDFVVKNGELTGKITSSVGPAELTAGKVANDTVSFTELLTFMEMKISVVYTGKVTSADEIKFTRVVGEFATEELVAKRVK
jgi:hypothetical protein